jgi:type III secretory pathway component EscR
VHSYFKMILLSAAIVVPVAVSAQDRDHSDHNQQSRRYEDKAHKDSHEWDANEDQAYRRYLQENHRKYTDFAKTKKKEQNNYWNWRHSHSDNDHR